MYRLIALCLSTISIGMICGCAMFSKPDPPPPLPPIEAPKPPLKMKSEYFNGFPWDELAKPSKDGNDKDSKLYTIKENDTFDSIALKQMGDSALGPHLATYNQKSPGDEKSGETIVIPNPIIGVSCQILVKEKGKKRFGEPQPFDTEFKSGDQYKLRFESNVTGYCYVFQHGFKGVRMLYPSQLKTGKRNKKKKPLARRTAEVKAHDPIIIPTGKAGFRYNRKREGDKVYVFLSINEIAELNDLMGKKKIGAEELQDVLHRVKEGEIYSDPPYWLLRISDPSEILGFTLHLNG